MKGQFFTAKQSAINLQALTQAAFYMTLLSQIGVALASNLIVFFTNPTGTNQYELSFDPYGNYNEGSATKAANAILSACNASNVNNAFNTTGLTQQLLKVEQQCPRAGPGGSPCWDVISFFRLYNASSPGDADPGFQKCIESAMHKSATYTSGFSPGEIIGITFGALALATITFGLCLFVRHKINQRRQASYERVM